MKSVIFSFLLILALPLSMNGNDFKGIKRITANESQNESNSWINFVKLFELSEIPEKSLTQIACDSKYWLWINEKLVVFEGQLKRGPTPNDTYYDEVDIAPYLKLGKNKIAILVWYFGKDGFSHKSSGQAGLVFKNDVLHINSDNTWLSRLNKAFEYTSRDYPNYRLSESNVRFDARKESFDWILLEDNLRGFGRAKVLGDAESSPWNKLVKRPIPLWKNSGLKEYKNKINFPFVSKGDTLILTLPYNAQITPYFKIRSDAGKVIDIRTDNYRIGNTLSVRAEYVTSSGLQEYESLGWMNGHQVRYYFPEGVEIMDVKYRETGYDTEFTGSFTCNDAFFNRLWEKALRTLYVTMRDTYMDCPDRERAQWWGDLVNESGEAFYALSPSAASLTQKGMLELINWQRSDGTIYSPVPGMYTSELPGQMLASIGYYGFWNYYMNTGDKETVEKVYNGVKKYLSVWETDEKGILVHREGDWYWGDWGTNIDKQGIFNAFYYLALKGFRNMSELLGYNGEVKKTQEKMDAFKKAFNAQLWKNGEYRSETYTGETDDRTQALAVVAGLADEAKFPEILQKLKTQKFASPYLEKYVLEALFIMGYEEYGLQRMKERYSEMINDPARTTLYELWNIGSGSVNHAWSGGGLTILSQYVCGVYPVEAAWKTIRIRPQMGSLTYAATENTTVNGKFSVEINKSNGKYRIHTLLPQESNAIVMIPVSYKKINLNNHLIWNGKEKRNQWSEYLGIDNGYHTFKIKSGNWNFVAE